MLKNCKLFINGKELKDKRDVNHITVYPNTPDDEKLLFGLHCGHLIELKDVESEQKRFFKIKAAEVVHRYTLEEIKNAKN